MNVSSIWKEPKLISILILSLPFLETWANLKLRFNEGYDINMIDPTSEEFQNIEKKICLQVC